MSQNGQTHFENYARNPVKSPNVSGVFRKLCINPIQDEPFFGLFLDEGVGGVKEVALPKICHTYSTMMRLVTVISHLNKIQKSYESRDTVPEFC